MVRNIESFKKQYEVLQFANPSLNKVLKQNTKSKIQVEWIVRTNDQEREEVLLNDSNVGVQGR